MIRASWAQPLCAILVFLLAVPSGFAQAPPAAPPPVVQPVPPTPSAQAAPKVPGAPLSITILEGNNVVNSIPLLRSIPAVIEVRDSNDLPVEDASVTFTLPEQGPGGTFVQGGKTFTTRSDARGQAIAPQVIPVGAGKFQIAVSATADDRKGQGVVSQTNSEGAYVGPPVPRAAWYKRKLIWAAAGGAAAAVVVIILLTRSKSTPPTVVITPGTPVFQ